MARLLRYRPEIRHGGNTIEVLNAVVLVDLGQPDLSKSEDSMANRLRATQLQFLKFSQRALACTLQYKVEDGNADLARRDVPPLQNRTGTPHTVQHDAYRV